MKTSKKNVLITGGIGFIGTNAAEYFSRLGWNVALVDNFSRPGVEVNQTYLKKKFPKIFFIKSDVGQVKNYLSKLKKADLIIHLAGQTAVTHSIENPVNDFDNNLQQGLALLEAIRTHNPQAAAIFSSTNKVYGDLADHDLKKDDKKQLYVNTSHPQGVDEQQVLSFISPYGCSKGSLDQYFLDYSRIYGLKTVVFRQSCIYGPHQIGVEDQGWVAHFSKKILDGEEITIFGNGFQVRDLLYVDDLVDAYFLAYQNINQCQGEVFNIGGGMDNAFSLLQVIDLLKKYINQKVKLSFSSSRVGDQKFFVSNNQKLLEKLDWQPKISFVDGVKKMIDWQRANLL